MLYKLNILFTMEKIYHSPPHMSGKEIEYIKNALDQNWVAPVGPQLDEFEIKLAQYVGAKKVLATNSGTSAIHLALRLLNIGKGDIVFCSSLTWIASVAPTIYLGAEPVFIDSESQSWNMSPQALQRALEEGKRKNKLPKAVIVVNLYGQSADMTPIIDFCNTYNIPIIEDSAQSLGAKYNGKHSGTIGHFGIYSFNGNKIITTSSGGALVSNNIEAIARAKTLSTHSRLPFKYHTHKEIGYNYRMSNINAAIGLAQIEVLNERITARRNIYSQYYKALSNLPGVTFVPELENSFSTRWMTAITIDPNEGPVTNVELINMLYKLNIEPRYVWMPQHLQPVMKNFSYYKHSENEDVSARLFNTGICLPSGSNLTDENFNRITESILEFYHS